MDFEYLYNPDNGICGPYVETIARNRADLIPLCKDELAMLRTMTAADILARRASRAASVASVMVEVNEETSDEQTPPAPVLNAPVAKGVTVVGKIPKQRDVDEFNFVDAKKDYRRYFIRGGEEFPAEGVAGIPDGDLVRFAKEALGRNYQDAPELGTNEEREAHYAMLREKLVKALTRINRRRAERRIEEAKNGGND